MGSSSAQTFGALLFYSLLMFTLPFLAYFGTQRFLHEHVQMTGFAKTAWSVASAVLVVNIIVFAYVWKALHEPVESEPSSDVLPESSEKLESDKKED